MRARLIAAATAAILSTGALAAASGARADDASSLKVSGSDAAPSSRHVAPPSTPRAAAPVVVGATGTPVTCAPGTTTWTQQASAVGTPYTVPGAGVITSYSTNANATAGSMRLVILGPAALPNNRTVLSFGPLQPLTVSTLNTFPVQIPVPAGASLGTFVNTSLMGCAFITAAPGDVLSGMILDPSISSAYVPAATFPSRALNLSAVWEPDADGDGFGDASQDLCPQSKLTQAACPAPDTKVTKKPKKSSAKRKAKIKFSSTIAGSTFTCAVDKKAAKACTSPFKKKLKYGKHKVVITAVSPFGITDPSPVTVKFKIKKPRR